MNILASIPEWSDRADPMLWFALALIVAIALGESARQMLHVPRISGYVLVGLLAGPAGLRLIDASDIEPLQPLVELALGVLLFELGSRVRLRWLLDNVWLSVASMLEIVLTMAAVFGALLYFGVSQLPAALAAAVAISTSPVIIVVVMNEARARGQVSERLLLLTALNSVAAVVAVKAWLVAGTHASVGNVLSSLVGPLYVLTGSLILGVAFGIVSDWLTRPFRGTAHTMQVLHLAIVVLTVALAFHFQLSPLLSLFVAGVVTRARVGQALMVEPNLGTAGAALTVFLFVWLGLITGTEGLRDVWPLVALIIGARLLAKVVAVVAVAVPSGISLRQGLALGLALQPMSGLALLLTLDIYRVAPQVDRPILQALMLATALLQLLGPVLTQSALRWVARETPMATETLTRPAGV